MKSKGWGLIFGQVKDPITGQLPIIAVDLERYLKKCDKLTIHPIDYLFT